MNRYLSQLLFIIAFFYNSVIYSACCGKIDIGPALIDVDILKSGVTEETLHMGGFKADATVLVWNGVCIKPSVIYGEGYGELASAGIGIGHCTPIPWVDGLILTPSVGIAYSYVTTHVDIEELGLSHLRERFRSSSPYLCLDLCYTFLTDWTLLASYQYAWSETHTKISHIVSEKSHCCGPSYCLGLEYAFNKHWAVNIGGAYNISLSKEKHGIRGKGIKMGLAYYF